MAGSSSNRDVTLTLNLETLGEADVAKLQTSLQQLAATGGEAAPEFQRLADEIGKLGAQTAAITSFQALTAEVEGLTAKQQATAAASLEMQQRLDALRESTAALQAQEKTATDALTAGQLAFVTATNALRSLNAEYDSTGKQSAEYRAQLQALTAVQNDARTALVALRANQRAATQDTNEAEASLTKLETAYGRQSAAATKAAAALAAGEAALRESAAAAATLGIATDDIATAEGNVVAAFNRGATALNTYTAAQEAAAQAIAAANWQAEAEQIVNAAEATQQLARETAAAAAAAQELAAQASFEKAAADAQKLLQAAEYVQLWTQSLDASEAAVRSASDAAQKGAQQIDNAFKTLGLGSVEALEAAIGATRAALATLASQGALTGDELAVATAHAESKVAALELQIRELNGTLTTGDKAAGAFSSTIGQFTAGNLAAQGIGFLVQKIQDLSAEFVNSIVELQKFNNALNAIYRDSTKTAAQLDFLRKTALSSGVAVGDLQGSFVKFSASMNAANVPLAQSNGLFEALTRASGTLGLSSEEVTGALEALSQMAGKGTVSMEELRQQLGDRLPGAMALTAKGLGLTEGELIKLVESGTLASRDLFPALTQSLKSLQGEVDGLTPGFNNLKTALTITAQSAGDSGWTQLLTNGLKGLHEVVTAVALIFAGFSEVLFGVAKAAGVLVGALFTLSNPMSELKQIVTDAAERQAKLTATLEGSTDAVTANTAAVTAQGAAVAGVAVPMNSLAQVVATTAAGQTALNLATTLAGNASLDASQKWVTLSVKLAENLTALEAAAASADKVTKATTSQGQALVALAQLRGNEQATLQAASDAATANAAAAEKSAAAHAAETEVLTVQKAAFLENAAARGLTQQQIENEVRTLDQKIVKSQAETDQSKAAVAQAQIEAATRQVAAQGYKDSSDNIEILRKTMVAATETAKAYHEAQIAGTATSEQATKADTEAAKASALYVKALADAEAKIKSVAGLQAAENDVTIAGLQAKQQAASAEAHHAATLGLTTVSIIDQITAVRAQIAVVQAQTQAKVASAQAEIDAALAHKRELEAIAPLTDAQKREIDTTLAAAKAKLIAAGASKSVVQGLNDEITALYDKLRADEAAANSTGRGIGTTNADTASRQANTSAIDAQTEALQRQKGLSSTGLTKADGSSNGTFNNALPLDQIYAVLNKRNAGGLTTADIDAVKAAVTQAQNANDYLHSAQNAGSVNPSALNTTGSQLTTLQQLLQSLLQQKQSEDLAAAKGSSAGATTPTTGLSPAGSTSHTVTINLGGKSTTIGTASAGDSTALTDLLKELQTAAGTSAMP